MSVFDQWSPWETIKEVRDESGRLISFAKTRALIKADGPSVTICPPGKAIGADDLRNWASRRLGGKSGVFNRKEAKRLKRWGRLGRSRND
jgi:hypothetical protein